MNKMLLPIAILIVTISLIFYAYFRFKSMLGCWPPVVTYIFTAVYWSMVAAFFYRMFIGESLNLTLSYISGIIGYNWFFIFIWMIIIIAGLDVLRLLSWLTRFQPSFILDNIVIVQRVFSLSILFFLVLLISVGNYRFNHPKVVRLSLNKDMIENSPVSHEEKTEENSSRLRIVMASDLHMSSYIAARDVKRFAKMINRENPDIVIFAGDLADRSIEPLERLDLGRYFGEIDSKYGLFAVPGNHETYGGKREDLFNLYRSWGIKVLKDSVYTIEDRVSIVGRDDRSNHRRESLDTLLKRAGTEIPVILVDHQPYDLGDYENRVLLYLGGHTHKGQFWPATAIVKQMYELAYGYLKRGSTHYYVSSGLGIWGPKIRLGSDSELVVIDLKYR